MKRFLPVAYALSLALIAWVSYAFVDPNLTLINQEWFVSWQRSMWELASNPAALANIFLGSTLVVALGYAGFLWSVKRQSIDEKNVPRLLLVVVIVLLLGYNAYSHDIFNYLFNAKMVVQYGGNPHEQVALDFPSDPWLRFMHNVHTPAPYGYGWTAVSLAPYLIGFGKFLPAYLSAKILMVLGLGLLLHFVWKLLKRQGHRDKEFQWLLLAFHPLLLLETLLNGHNDVWMMWPALAAWYFLKGKRRLAQLVLVAALMVFSISIKFATVLLVPLMLFEFVPKSGHRLIDWAQRHWAELSALALMVPLLTDRSQQFHPWYLIWPLSFLPFIQWKWLRYGILGLSISSLFRYLPWVAAGFQYTDQIQLELRLITWSGLIVGWLFWLSQTVNNHHHHHAKNNR